MQYILLVLFIYRWWATRWRLFLHHNSRLQPPTPHQPTRIYRHLLRLGD